MIFARCSLLLLTSLLAAQDPEATPEGRTHYLGREIAQTMHWTGAPWLLRATREAEENGQLLREWLAVSEGATICDFGCGNGYHTLPLADAVGPDGKVYAVEIQPQMLALLAARAKKRGIDNLVQVVGTVDDPKLPNDSCDLVLMVDVYHELSHPVRIMEKVRASLRTGGRVVLVEFRAEDPLVPIKPEHTMSKAQIVREMAVHGFALAESFDELPWQHAMAFVVADVDDPRHAQRQLAAAFAEELRADNRMTIAAFATEESAAAGLAPPTQRTPIELRAGIDGDVLARGVADRELRMRCDADGRWWIAGAVDARPAVRPHGGTGPFYAMHTGTGGGSIDAQAALVAELGFDGLAWGLEELAAARFAAERRGGDVISAYAVLDVDAVTPADNDAALAPLVAAMETLRGGPGQLWLAMTRSRTVPNDEAFDVPTEVLRRLIPHARSTGVEIALYPHHGFWLQGHEQAVRLCENVGAAELGVMFNLCHWLRAKESEDVGAAVRALGQRLFAVTIHGADRDDQDWSTLIRPLGEGSFAVDALLDALDAMGFEGPMALQGYGLRAPARENLAASIAAWRRLHERSRSPSTRRE